MDSMMIGYLILLIEERDRMMNRLNWMIIDLVNSRL